MCRRDPHEACRREYAELKVAAAGDLAKLRADLDRAQAHNRELAKANHLADCERLERENQRLRTQLLELEARVGWGGFV